MMGTVGRWRAMARAVRPDTVKVTMAAARISLARYAAEPPSENVPKRARPS